MHYNNLAFCTQHLFCIDANENRILAWSFAWLSACKAETKRRALPLHRTFSWAVMSMRHGLGRLRDGLVIAFLDYTRNPREDAVAITRSLIGIAHLIFTTSIHGLAGQW